MGVGLISAVSLESVLVRARKLVSPDLSVQQLLVLTAVYNGGSRGIEQGELITKYGVSRSHASKTVADLSALTSAKKEGPGLIRSDLDPRDFRIRMITCTDKGVDTVRKMLGEKP